MVAAAMAAEAAKAEVVAADAMTTAPKQSAPNCNKMVVHAAAKCFMLPANKDKIPSWYKPPNMD
jgi:hypothetical protein